MRIEQFEQLLTIAAQKTLSQAARELFISQPSLSASLNQTEEELRLKIFERSKFGLIPTTQGDEVLRLAQNILELTDKIKEVMDGKRGLIRHLQMAIPAALATAVAPGLLRRFKECYPEVMLHIHETPNYDIIDLMDKGAYSIGVVSCSDNLEKDLRRQLEAKNIANDFIPGNELLERVLYISSSNPLAQRKIVSMAELEGMRMISYKENYTLLAKDYDHLTRTLTVVRDMEFLKKLIIADFGYSIFPRFLAVNDLYVTAQKIQVIPIKDGLDAENIHILYTGKDLLATIEQDLRILVGQQLKSLLSRD